MGAASVRAEPVCAASMQWRPAHDIASLDGLRAVSICIVILSHTRSFLPPSIAKSGLFRYVIGGGLHGVQIFFVLSGYLITTLLLREYERTGNVSLRRFYARRSLRIFPPFYAYLAVLALLWIAGILSEHWPTYLAAATYTFIYFPHPQGWQLMHTWSLSIEEQFYLLWPIVLVATWRQRKSLPLALGVLAGLPLVRIVLFFALAHPAGRVPEAVVLSGSIDTLLVGCCLALLQNRAPWRETQRRFIHGASVAGLLVLGFLLVPYASAKIPDGPVSACLAAFSPTITALSIGSMVVYVVENVHSLAGRFLNLAPIRHIGILSYSLYLWQQFFSSESKPLQLANYLFMFLAAEASFWIIEKPVLRLRTRLGI